MIHKDDLSLGNSCGIASLAPSFKNDSSGRMAGLNGRFNRKAPSQISTILGLVTCQPLKTGTAGGIAWSQGEMFDKHGEIWQQVASKQMSKKYLIELLFFIAFMSQNVKLHKHHLCYGAKP